ncbi:MAG TPA: tetratricopeptide repeat protein, partial [Candidatus Solibacter sp.]|nr:tetratricopeptide repeat protein [Candidatus Solibacter sp.]
MLWLRVARSVGWRACIAGAFLFTVMSPQTTQPGGASTQAGTDREQAAHHDQRGVAAAQSGDLTAAIQQFQAALRLEPAFAEALYHLALAYERGGRTDDAISAYEEVLRLHPDLVEARYMLAECCAKRGDFEGELRLLSEVVARKPEFAEARYNYGLALTKQNRGTEALQQLRAAAKLNPANPKIAMALGVALADRDARQAVEVLRSAVRLEAANAETHYNLALALAANGDDDEARQ